jgi:hypothetical protein
MKNLTATSDAQSEYLVLQFSYTTAEIEESRFSGETPDPFHFTAPQPPPEESPLLVLTVIDGEPRLVKDEAPPDARLPDPSSRLFDLANEPESVAAA